MRGKHPENIRILTEDELNDIMLGLEASFIAMTFTSYYYPKYSILN